MIASTFHNGRTSISALFARPSQRSSMQPFLSILDLAVLTAKSNSFHTSHPFHSAPCSLPCVSLYLGGYAWQSYIFDRLHSSCRSTFCFLSVHCFNLFSTVLFLKLLFASSQITSVEMLTSSPFILFFRYSSSSIPPFFHPLTPLLSAFSLPLPS